MCMSRFKLVSPWKWHKSRCYAQGDWAFMDLRLGSSNDAAPSRFDIGRIFPHGWVPMESLRSNDAAALPPASFSGLETVQRLSTHSWCKYSTHIKEVLQSSNWLQTQPVVAMSPVLRGGHCIIIIALDSERQTARAAPDLEALPGCKAQSFKSLPEYEPAAVLIWNGLDRQHIEFVAMTWRNKPFWPAWRCIHALLWQ